LKIENRDTGCNTKASCLLTNPLDILLQLGPRDYQPEADGNNRWKYSMSSQSHLILYGGNIMGGQVYRLNSHNRHLNMQEQLIHVIHPSFCSEILVLFHIIPCYSKHKLQSIMKGGNSSPAVGATNTSRICTSMSLSHTFKKLLDTVPSFNHSYYQDATYIFNKNSFHGYEVILQFWGLWFYCIYENNE
jgi:hypothetical protein